MSVHVAIVDGPLEGASPSGPWPAGAGAMVEFLGVVRATEDDRLIEALEYQAYLPMAEQELRRLAELIVETHGLIAIGVWHSRGRVPAGRASFRLVVASAHRKQALAAMDEFIDRMKRDVPIWKSVAV